MANLANLGLDSARKMRDGAQQFGATSAMNDFRRVLSQQRGERNMRDFQQATSKNLGKLVSAYSQRGLRNSGIRQQGVGEFGAQAAQQQQDIANATRDEQTALDLEKRNADAAYQSLITDLEVDKTGNIADMFAQLSQYYPFLGS